jgi:uncharacterized protein YjbJ (UPF0337 family)
MTDVTESTQAPAPTGATASTAAAAKEQAGSVAASAATEAKGVASEAATEAKNVLADARKQLRSQAEEQSAKVAAVAGDIAAQLRRMAAAGESGPAKDIVTGVADQAQQMSQRLGDGGLDRTLEDARRLARNRPGLFLAGAAVAGFVAARVVRAADTDSLKQAASASNGSGNLGSSAPAGSMDTPSLSVPEPATGAFPTEVV